MKIAVSVKYDAKILPNTLDLFKAWGQLEVKELYPSCVLIKGEEHVIELALIDFHYYAVRHNGNNQISYLSTNLKEPKKKRVKNIDKKSVDNWFEEWDKAIKSMKL